MIIQSQLIGFISVALLVIHEVNTYTIIQNWSGEDRFWLLRNLRPWLVTQMSSWTGQILAMKDIGLLHIDNSSYGRMTT